jgi:hypothetical protein
MRDVIRIDNGEVEEEGREKRELEEVCILIRPADRGFGGEDKAMPFREQKGLFD